MQRMRNNRIQHLYFVGIGGAGMSGIAEVLHENGFKISGSDTGNGPVIQYLKSLGIQIFSEHKGDNIGNADLLVYSSAIQKDNPEIQEAQNRRIPIIRRAEMLGELMRLKYTLAIAGTHGKTTTTSLVGCILETAEVDPTIIVGGIVKGKGSGAKVGRGNYLVAESDEFDRSFLSMMPSSAIITNIDEDHLDTYADLQEIKEAFVEFSNKVPFYGQIIVCLDDANVQSVLSRLRKPVVTYGFNRQAKYRIENLNFDNGLPCFEVLNDGVSLGKFTLKIPGTHNVLNATAAIALTNEENIPIEIIRKAVASFEGVKRRFEYLGKTKSGAFVYDDYAHHPTEVAATLQGFRDTFPDKRLIVAFQPHLFSRTRDHYETFGSVFSNCDELLVCDIYPARELPIEGVTGELISKSAQERGHRDARFVGEKENVLSTLSGTLSEKDLVVLMGAGNITQLGRQLLENDF